MHRDEAIKAIRAGLKRRSGKAWSVTGGRGTAWGWIRIESPPTRRTWGYRLKAGSTTDRPEDYEGYDTGKPGGSMTPTEQEELARLLGLEAVHQQGEHVPASTDYYHEFVARANGEPPPVVGKPYWD